MGACCGSGKSNTADDAHAAGTAPAGAKGKKVVPAPAMNSGGKKAPPLPGPAGAKAPAPPAPPEEMDYAARIRERDRLEALRKSAEIERLKQQGGFIPTHDSTVNRIVEEKPPVVVELMSGPPAASSGPPAAAVQKTMPPPSAPSADDDEFSDVQGGERDSQRAVQNESLVPLKSRGRTAQYLSPSERTPVETPEKAVPSPNTKIQSCTERGPSTALVEEVNPDEDEGGDEHAGGKKGAAGFAGDDAKVLHRTPPPPPSVEELEASPDEEEKENRLADIMRKNVVEYKATQQKGVVQLPGGGEGEVIVEMIALVVEDAADESASPKRDIHEVTVEEEEGIQEVSFSSSSADDVKHKAEATTGVAGAGATEQQVPNDVDNGGKAEDAIVEEPDSDGSDSNTDAKVRDPSKIYGFDGEGEENDGLVEDVEALSPNEIMEMPEEEEDAEAQKAEKVEEKAFEAVLDVPPSSSSSSHHDENEDSPVAITVVVKEERDHTPPIMRDSYTRYVDSEEPPEIVVTSTMKEEAPARNGEADHSREHSPDAAGLALDDIFAAASASGMKVAALEQSDEEDVAKEYPVEEKQSQTVVEPSPDPPRAPPQPRRLPPPLPSPAQADDEEEKAVEESIEKDRVVPSNAEVAAVSTPNVSGVREVDLVDSNSATPLPTRRAPATIISPPPAEEHDVRDINGDAFRVDGSYVT